MKSFSILLIFLASACGGNSAMDVSSAPSAMMEIAADASPAMSRKVSGYAQSSAQEFEKKVIKTGSLTYRVESNQEEYERIQNLLEKYEAFISAENEHKGGDRLNFNVSVKVPPQHFEALIADVSKEKTIENRWVNSSDVTERYYDLESRIENKKQLEERYREILQDARTVSELLEVERSLNQVRSEIESLQGQFKMLNHQIDYSSIDISFYEILPYQVVDDQRPGFGKRILNALSGGWGILLSVIVGLVQLWPFALLALVVLWIIKKVRSRSK